MRIDIDPEYGMLFGEPVQENHAPRCKGGIMTTDQSFNILKEAILLERRGQAFYRKVASQTEHAEIKEFFEMMAWEEARHIEILEEQFTALAQSRQFKEIGEEMSEEAAKADQILSSTLKQKISAVEFEAAAISAAMLMEERAIALYSEQAQATEDPNEAELYRWLADWERGHLSFLARLDKEIREAVWNDQQFWPF
jgi:rubrerythrin